MGAVETECLEERAERCGVADGRVVAVGGRGRGVAVAGKIDGDDVVACGELSQDRAPVPVRAAGTVEEQERFAVTGPLVCDPALSPWSASPVESVFNKIGAIAPRSQPRTRLAVDTRRQQLVRAGVDLLRTRTPDEVSIDDVARAAGISRGLLYHYFEDKDAFVVAILQEWVRSFAEHCAETRSSRAASGSTPRSTPSSRSPRPTPRASAPC